jgi:uncharacterized protein (TIGR02145 family)
MAENLNYEMQDSYCYNDDGSNCKKYGRLYSWKAALYACPVGWHLPGNIDFKTLYESAGGKQVAGKKLKNKEGWNNNGNGTDDFGFSALSAGAKDNNGRYIVEGYLTLFWGSMEKDCDKAFGLLLNFGADSVNLESGSKDFRWSVRCIKDETVVPATEVTVDSVTDSRDGQTYKTLKIGTQTWMAKNLNYKADSSFCYDNEESNCAKYGRFYKWDDALRACPSGWHLPSKAEFETLIGSVGDKQFAGRYLKSKEGWSYSGNGTDAFGFSVLPAGIRGHSGNYGYEGDYAFFWSSAENNSSNAYYMSFSCFGLNASLGDTGKNIALTVRCVKD